MGSRPELLGADRLGFVRGEHDTEDIAAECRGYGVTVEVVTADLAQADVPERLVATAAASGGLPEAGSPASSSTATAGSVRRAEPAAGWPGALESSV
jgi:hypothetical protein